MVACVFVTVDREFRIILRSKARANAKQGYFGDDGPVTGICCHRNLETARD
jgi:hypothetical protein